MVAKKSHFKNHQTFSMNTPSARDVEEPSDGLDAEDIKFLRSLRTSATPGPSRDGEAGERLGGPGIARRLSSRTVKKLEVASDEIPRLLAPMPGARAGNADLPRAPGGHLGAGGASPGPLPALASLAAP